jgi:hypothetical protein
MATIALVTTGRRQQGAQQQRDTRPPPPAPRGVRRDKYLVPRGSRRGIESSAAHLPVVVVTGLSNDENKRAERTSKIVYTTVVQYVCVCVCVQYIYTHTHTRRR